jgi:hypothetical protein
MRIVIPDDYQDVIHKLDAFKLLGGMRSSATASRRAIWMSWWRG